jgi:hypothetical protein
MRPPSEAHQRDDVVGLETGLDDQIDESRRQQTVGVAVAAKARHAHARADVVEAGGFFGRHEHAGMGRG